MLNPSLETEKGCKTTLGAWGDSLLLTLGSNGVAVLSVNTIGGVNAISSDFLKHLDAALDFIESESAIKAVVFTSGKKDHFLLGADIKEILRTQSQEVAYQLASHGHRTFDRIANFKMPFLVAINGTCLGGGLELALCCDARLASDDSKTMLGMPEVNLGLIPGLGGTQRLYRLIGLKAALELILGAEPISTRRALDLGLLDRIVPAQSLLSEAEAHALALVADGGRNRLAERQKREVELDEREGGLKKRQSLLKMSERAVRIKTKGFYPAPKMALEVIDKGLSEGIEAALEAEARAFSELAVSPVAKHMINLYISKEMVLKSASRCMEQAGAVTTLGIIGTSTMGTSIAELAISRGVSVIMKGSSPDKAEQAVTRLRKKLQSRKDTDPIVDGNGSPESSQEQSSGDACSGFDSGIASADSDEDLRPAQLIIEAVTEDIDLKNKVMYELSRAVGADCIIASNTSSFAISHLSQFSNKADRVIGLHFFNPVDRMPLVEVVTHQRTNPEVAKRAIGLVGRLGKIPLQVNDGPGFLVNRLLCLYMLEASRMFDGWAPLNWIEDEATSFGMPVAPMVLYDELGWRLSASVADMLYQRLGQRYLPSGTMHRTIADGRYDGRKTLAGFYEFDASGKRGGLNAMVCEHVKVGLSDQAPDPETRAMIRDRLFLPMVDEAARCLEEKIVRKAREIDLALVMGIGFPPFRGGLLRYADDLGIDYIVSRLEEIYSKFEPKRSVSNLLLEFKSKKRGFYSSTHGEQS